MAKRYTKQDDKNILATVNLQGPKKTDWEKLQKVISGKRSIHALKNRYYTLNKPRKRTTKKRIKVEATPGTSYSLLNRLIPLAKTKKQEDIVINLFKSLGKE